ncbi:MAG: undecaprenyldiphospho-muramoylpentapeptide beta-N-acetylglucosaminyltransferase, partial [Acidobacteriota bacterium]
MASRHALLAGGGTGGHIFPALALGAELLRRGWRVSFVGTAHGMEATLVPARGFAFHALPAKPLLGRGALAQVRALATVTRSALAARALVRREAVDVVVGTGGYASAPAVLGAWLARRPALLFEPNAHAGRANRWLSRFASAAAVAFAPAATELACATEVSGVPVRPEFFAVPEALPGAPDPAVLVLGGSQGAQSLNRALPPAVTRLAERLPGLRIVHQCGVRHLDEVRALWAAVPGARVEVVPFVEDVAGAMAGADLIVSRAGAVTLAEICAAGRPALLLPLGVAGGHQIDNARVLQAAGAARLLLPEELGPEALAAALGALLIDRTGLAAMAHAARAL